MIMMMMMIMMMIMIRSCLIIHIICPFRCQGNRKREKTEKVENHQDLKF